MKAKFVCVNKIIYNYITKEYRECGLVNIVGIGDNLDDGWCDTEEGIIGNL